MADLVVTPGGPRPSSDVHFVENGVQLHNTGNQIHLIAPDGNVLSRIDLEVPKGGPTEPGAMGSGWITFSHWWNGTGDPISNFSTTWTVPKAPATQSGQTIFLFNGIEPGDGSHILQPVLQWGPSAAGGGKYWAVASWYVGGGQAFHSSLVKVKEGDVLVGDMVLDRYKDKKFDYTCIFSNIENTSLRVTGNPELKWAMETLEAYGIKKCSDYPATSNTLMTLINISLVKRPSLKWSITNRITDCGQKTTVAVDGATDGQVNLYYK